MSIQINGTGGLTFPDASTQATAATGFGFKNRIINGAMMIDQRNAGASVTPTTLYSQYTLDRWTYNGSQASKASVQQNAGSVTPPTGFRNYLGITSLSSYSVTSSDFFGILQHIEGFNTADLAFGTASASSVTLSFWVRSSLTGTFGGNLANSANNRNYVFSYTINAANTWEQKSITIAGDTTGTWLTTNGIGLQVVFSIGSGSNFTTTAGSWSASATYAPTGQTSVVGTNGATFYITGVQLEKGSTATSFDYRPYGTELALCQRYCPVFDLSSGDLFNGIAANSTLSDYRLEYKVTVRTPATGITTTTSNIGVSNLSAGGSATLAFSSSGYENLSVRATSTAGSPTISQGIGTVLYATGAIKIIGTGCEL